jgi:hypothetical protein
MYATALDSSAVATILATCSQNKLLLGCGPVNNTVLTVAVMDDRADVLYNCGSTPICSNLANGVAWYFSDSFSWSFAQGGDTVSRGSCDTESTNGAYCLCWHTTFHQLFSNKQRSIFFKIILIITKYIKI